MKISSTFIRVFFALENCKAVFPLALYIHLVSILWISVVIYPCKLITKIKTIRMNWNAKSERKTCCFIDNECMVNLRKLLDSIKVNSEGWREGVRQGRDEEGEKD